MLPRILTTPIDAPRAAPIRLEPRAVAPEVLEAVLPGPGRDRLAAGPVLAVTTGQQPGLFTGPLYTVYKALSAAALAHRIERERKVPVVPVFWVAGDDHDFAEANHAVFIDTEGEAARIVLRERPPAAAQISLSREPCGPEILPALDRLKAATPDTAFKADVLRWLGDAYRPERSLAEAAAAALHELLSAHGIAIFRAHHPAAKRAAAPWLVQAIDVTLPDGYSPVLVHGSQGRDRLQYGEGRFRARRSGESGTVADIEELAKTDPGCLSPNVLLRPVIEAALFPTVAYAAGPGELEYLPDAAPLYQRLGVTAQTPVPRWSGVLVENRIDKVLERQRLTPDEFAGPAGQLESRLMRDAMPDELQRAFEALRSGLERDYDALAPLVARQDPTLERTVTSARNAALGGTRELEKKVVAALKRSSETLMGQIGRARAALYPEGQPQERVLTYASFGIRYGPALLDGLAAEVARWTDAS